MKKYFYSLLVFLICTSVFTSCWNWNWGGNEPDDFQIESAYEPILMTRDAMESSINLGDPKTMNESGKIYLAQSYILINDKREGFHIYNNEDPTNPILIKFLEVPGSTDVAIRNNTMYINQATDLIAITFDSNFQSFEITERIENIFPRMTVAPDGVQVNYDNNKINIGWRLK